MNLSAVVGAASVNLSKPLLVKVSISVACLQTTVADRGDLSIKAISPMELPLASRAMITFSPVADFFRTSMMTYTTKPIKSPLSPSRKRNSPRCRLIKLMCLERSFSSSTLKLSNRERLSRKSLVCSSDFAIKL